MKQKVSALGSPRKKTSNTPYRFAHTAGSKKGLGDYYGTGIRQPLGKLRANTVGMVDLSKKQLHTPPKTYA